MAHVMQTIVFKTDILNTLGQTRLSGLNPENGQSLEGKSRTNMETRRRIVVLAAVLLFSVTTVPGAAQSALAQQGKTPQKLCPVMGGEIDKSVYTDYEGKRVYFCCAGCIESFRKAPDKYIEKMEAQGIVLGEAPETGAGSAMKSGARHEGSGHSGEGHGGHMHSMHHMH